MQIASAIEKQVENMANVTLSPSLLPKLLLPSTTNNVPKPIRETAARYNQTEERGDNSSLACSAHGLGNCSLSSAVADD